jgi:predicted ATP-binding protein involved in virulence
MLLKTLTLTNIRAFNHAEITFQPGMNLIVGINGVGKSTILDALRIVISQALPKLSASRVKPLSFQNSDIFIENWAIHIPRILRLDPDGKHDRSKNDLKPNTIPTKNDLKPNKIPIIWLLLREFSPIAGIVSLYPSNQNALTIDLTFQVDNIEFRYLRHQPREKYISTADSTSKTDKNVDRHILTPNDAKTLNSLKKSQQQPIALYFSPRRALANTSNYTKSKSSIFSDALDHRELRLMEFSDWFFAQKDLAQENAPNAQSHLNALEIAVKRFMDSFGALIVRRDSTRYQDKKGNVTRKFQTTFLIEKSGIQLDIRQLSDGERSILALVLDLARRLSIANPTLDDPLQGKAVVLIDELDLHLHPQWQRSIVSKLTSTFPNCQFIATTHSPLIIGEVPPDNIILLRQENDRVNVIQQSDLAGFGLDSSWILRQIMDTDSRNPTIKAQLDRIEESLEEGDLDLARQHLEQYKTMIYGQRDDEFIRLEASINNLEALADALDTEEE